MPGMKLIFTCEPTNTGAFVTIADGTRNVLIFAWDVTDWLGDLMRCLNQLLQGYDYAWCHWEDDPGGYKWVFRRDDVHEHLKILRFAASSVGYGAPEEWAEVLFEMTCPLTKLAAKVRNEARRLLDNVGGPVWYQRVNGQVFPLDNYETLRRLLAEHRR
jgi:hypothetical protein